MKRKFLSSLYEVYIKEHPLYVLRRIRRGLCIPLEWPAKFITHPVKMEWIGITGQWELLGLGSVHTCQAGSSFKQRLFELLCSLKIFIIIPLLYLLYVVPWLAMLLNTSFYVAITINNVQWHPSVRLINTTKLIWVLSFLRAEHNEHYYCSSWAMTQSWLSPDAISLISHLLIPQHHQAAGGTSEVGLLDQYTKISTYCISCIYFLHTCSPTERII